MTRSLLRFLQQCGDAFAGQFAGDEVARGVMAFEFADLGIQATRKDAVAIDFVEAGTDAGAAVN